MDNFPFSTINFLFLSMPSEFMPIILVLITFSALWLLQRWVHTHLHGLSLLLMGNQERATILYALVLLPGVFLHESSHWLTAKILGVRTAGFSLIPRRQANGSVQLGYVQYYKTANVGAIRESLIGGAPLIVGTAVILLIGFQLFNLPELLVAIQAGDVDMLSAALRQLFEANNLFVWLYLIFAITNAMMPSASDRRAWPAFLAMMGAVAFVLVVLDLQGVLWQGIAEPTAVIFGYLGLAFGMGIAVDFVAIVVIISLEALVSKVRGVNVVYGG